MSKHAKLVNRLLKLRFLEESQRSIKQIRERIEHYEKRNLELVSKWPNGMPEWYGMRNITYIPKSAN